MADDLPWQTLTALAQRLARSEISSRELVAACLASIDARDGKLHAFVDVWRDDALAQADALDRERRAGGVRGPLHGLPIALKDLLHIEGRQTTAGSKSWLGRRSDHTATAATRLVAAGMIPLGKTHMVEFAFGGWGRNQPMGAPWNPWDMDTHRVAGGSSSGSAVAVAAGLAPAAIGSDTGGSIRIPAALCGLTGLKPTYGLVSLHGAVPLSSTLDSLGPLAHSADDAALLVAAMAGADPRDAATQNAPTVDFATALRAGFGLRGVRITALSPERFPACTLPDVARATSDAQAVLADLGATVTVEDVPLDFDDLMRANGLIIAAEAWALHRAYIEDVSLDIDPWVRSGSSAARPSRPRNTASSSRGERSRWRSTPSGCAGATRSSRRPCRSRRCRSRRSTSRPRRSQRSRVLRITSAPARFRCRRDSPSTACPSACNSSAHRSPTRRSCASGRAYQSATDWHRRRPAPGA